MRKFIVIILLRLGILPLSAQVGINTSNPKSTLDVCGSLSTAYTINTESSYEIKSSDYYITNCSRSKAEFILPKIESKEKNFKGRIYKINNASKFDLKLKASKGTLRQGTSSFEYIEIPPGGYIEVVNNGSVEDKSDTWDLLISQPVDPSLGRVGFYFATLTIPPHQDHVADWDDHTNQKYDSGSANDRWIIKSKKSYYHKTKQGYHRPSRMTITYEYNGYFLDYIDTKEQYPFFSIKSVDRNTTDSFLVGRSFIERDKTTKDKFIITVDVLRLDYIGCDDQGRWSDWKNPINMDLLLITNKLEKPLPPKIQQIQ